MRASGGPCYLKVGPQLEKYPDVTVFVSITARTKGIADCAIGT